MKSIKGVGLAEVTALYSAAQGEFMQILFGEQIHIGGMKASIDLAERAEIKPGSSGIDLCCCNGADMRWLVRFRGVASMIGVDATERVVERGRRICAEEGLADRIKIVLADGPATWTRGALCKVVSVLDLDLVTRARRAGRYGPRPDFMCIASDDPRLKGK